MHSSPKELVSSLQAIFKVFTLCNRIPFLQLPGRVHSKNLTKKVEKPKLFLGPSKTVKLIVIKQ